MINKMKLNCLILDVTTAGSSSPVVEKSSLSFQHSDSPSSTSSNEERSPKLPQNNGNLNMTPSSNADPMRVRSSTTAVPNASKKSTEMMPPSPNPTLEKKRNVSDSVVRKFIFIAVTK